MPVVKFVLGIFDCIAKIKPWIMKHWWNVKIQHPTPTDIIPMGWVDMSGSLRFEPDGPLYLVTGKNPYYPFDVNIDAKTKMWKGRVHMGSPNQRQKAKIMIVKPDDGMRYFIQHYRKCAGQCGHTGMNMDKWPETLQKLDEVTVNVDPELSHQM